MVVWVSTGSIKGVMGNEEERVETITPSSLWSISTSFGIVAAGVEAFSPVQEIPHHLIFTLYLYFWNFSFSLCFLRSWPGSCFGHLGPSFLEITIDSAWVFAPLGVAVGLMTFVAQLHFHVLLSLFLC